MNIVKRAALKVSGFVLNGTTTAVSYLAEFIFWCMPAPKKSAHPAEQSVPDKADR